MLFQLMEILEKTNKLEEANIVAYNVVKNYSNDYKKLIKAAAVFIKSQNLYAAVKTYLRAHYLKPNEHTPAHNLGYLALEMDQKKAAKIYFYKAVENKLDFLNSRLSLVDCLIGEGHINTARKILEKGKEFANENFDLDTFAFYYKTFFEDKLSEIYKNYKERDKIIQKYANTFFVLDVLYNSPQKYNTLNILLNNFKDTSLKGGNKKADKLNKIATLLPLGRSGSLFFHSLFDGSKDIATIPGVYFKGFFGNGVWQRLYNKKEKNWKKGLVERFLRMYEAVFDANSSAPVPGDPMSGKTGIGVNCGLTNMGENQDIALKVDKYKFKEKLLELLDNYTEISQKEFFKLIHIAWEEIKDPPQKNKKLILYHIHNPTISEFAKFIKLFPESKNIFIVRNPIKAAESWMYTQWPDEEKLQIIEKMNIETKKNTLKFILSNAYGRLFTMLLFSRNLINISKNTYAVKLETLKEHPKETMQKICDILEIEFDKELLKSEFLGYKYYGPKSKLHKNIQGFDKSNIKRDYVLFSQNDLELIETVFYPYNKALNYPTKEIDTYSIKKALIQNETILDFEKKFASIFNIELNEEEFEIIGKRKRIFKYILDHYDIILQDFQKITLIG